MTKLMNEMQTFSNATSLKNSTDLSCKNVVDRIAWELSKRHNNLSLDEWRIVVHANQILKGLKLTSVVGGPVPDGYFDSDNRFGFLGNHSQMRQYCQGLAASGCLVEHSSVKGMYRISDEMASECDEIASHLGWKL